MGLKDLKSDLSKFRIPKKTNLVDKSVNHIKTKTDKTPLSQLANSSPNISQANETPKKQGKDVSKFNNHVKFNGETTPTKFDNESNFLGETTPNEFDNDSQFLGETDSNPLNTNSQFLGETDKKPVEKKPYFLGESDKKPLARDSQFLGETKKTPLENPSEFLGETNVTPVGNSDQFLGETDKEPINPNSQFLGETDKKPINPNSQFLGETNVNNLETDSQFLGETDKEPINPNSQFLGETDKEPINPNSQFLGETNVNNLETDSQFLGETNVNNLETDSQFLGETTLSSVNFISDIHADGFTQKVKDTKFTGIDPSRTVFDSGNSLYSNIDDNSFTLGKTYEDGFKTAGGLNSGEIGFGIGKAHAKRNSPSYLDELYNRYNLKDDSFNSQFSIFRHPLILRGIQRSGVGKKEPQSWGFKSAPYDDGFIRGGAVTSTARALVDVLRISTYLASPEGLLFSVRQVGLQRTNTYGKHWNPTSLLTAVGAQHLGLKPERSSKLPFDGDDSYKYGFISNQIRTIRLLANVGGLFSSISSMNDNSINGAPYKDLQSLHTRLMNEGDDLQIWKRDVMGGPDSFYGIGETTTRRYVNTFNKNHINDTGKLITNYEVAEYSELKIVDSFTEYNDFRLDLSDGNKYRELALKASYSKKNIDNSTDRGVLLGSPGKINKDLVKISTEVNKLNTDSDIYDKLNASDVSADEHNDLVKFWIKADGGESVQFRGTVNGITDAFSPGWDSFKYNGRADQSYKYSTFERTVTFNFQVYATSRVEMKPIWNKINYLATMTMPKYAGDPGYEGTLVNFTLGDLYNKKLAFIESLNYTMPDELPWDVDMDNNLGVLPTGIDVNISFKILDDVRPEIGQKVYDPNFITTYLQ
jgi:hypothetical protein